MQTKPIWASKTLWLAVLQGVAGVVVVLQSSMPEVGGLVILKSAIDIMFRVVTTTKVTV
jgi:hypothetical protein